MGGAAIVVRSLRLTAAATVAGVALGVAGVSSVWNCLRVVGLTPDGGRLVDGSRLAQLALPFDMEAAASAVELPAAAVAPGRPTVHRTAHASAQS